MPTRYFLHIFVRAIMADRSAGFLVLLKNLDCFGINGLLSEPISSLFELIYLFLRRSPWEINKRVSETINIIVAIALISGVMPRRIDENT